MARQRQPRTCKKCNEGNLYWKSFNGSWRLSTIDGMLHVCHEQPRCHGQPREGPEVRVDVPSVADMYPQVQPQELKQASKTDEVNAGRTLYELVRPFVSQDLADAVSRVNIHPAPIEHTVVVTLPGQEETPLAVVHGAHKQTAQMVKILSLGLHVMLVGPAGSGKTNAAEQAATALGLKFYPQSVGAQTSKTDLLGYQDAHGQTVRTILREAYEHGGVYLLDEVDAGNANVLTILNAALANDYCSFPDKVVKRHEHFHLIAAGNTYGNGANRQYVGRNQLDAATLNRFVTINWEYDESLERKLGESQPEWTEYVLSLRKAQARTGVRAIFSTRAILYGVKLLNAGVTRDEVESMVLWNAIGVDDRAKLTA